MAVAGLGCFTLIIALTLCGEASAGGIVNFTAPTSFTLPINPEAVAVGDFNGDGDPDLAIANDASGNVSILVGGAGGSFTGPTNFAAGTGPHSVAVGDFNGDSDPDLAVPVQSAGPLAGGMVAILLGGTGATFGSPTFFAVGASPSDVVVGEFNGDSDPDLAVTNRDTDNVSVLLGSGAAAATFATATSFAVGDRPSSIEARDFNGDGDPDLAVANGGPLTDPANDTVSILTGDPASGRFVGPTNFTVGNLPTGVAAGDFNGDLDPDLAIANEGSSTVSILTGGAGAAFAGPTNLSGGARSVAVADFNKDSDLDLAVGGNAGNNLSIFVGGAGATFAAPQVFPAGGVVESVAVADFNARASTLLNTTDLAPPNTTISSGPSGSTNDNTPTFGFSSSEPTGATFECRVYQGAPSGTFSACSSPHTTAPLADGSHTFEVRARDAAGNVDPSPASQSFTVDTTPPNTTIDSGPTGTTSDNTPTFGFSSEAGAAFECRLYQGTPSGTFSACTSPHTTGALADGAWTFEVRARDPAGNLDATPAQRSFSVDTGAPAGPTFAGTTPASPANDNSPEIRGSAETGSTVRLYTTASCIEPPVATGSAATFASPGITVTVPDNSTTTFYAKAQDATGNLSPCSLASITYVEDSSAPETTIDSGPTGTTSDNTPTFGFSSEAGAAFECRLYQGTPSGTFSACTSPHTTEALAEGAWTFEVRAVDGAGNFDPTPATRSFDVERAVNQQPGSPPDTQIVQSPPQLTKERTPSFSFSSSSPGTTFECSLDGSPFQPCNSPYVTPRLAPGRHVFQVRARDRVGNVDDTPASVVFAVAATLSDLPPPALGKTFNIEPKGDGDVFVSETAGASRARASATVPGIKGRNFVPLREARQVKVGSIIDTRKGTVRLVSARDSKGTTQSGEFVAGVFQVLQSRKSSAKGLTELRLKGSSFKKCRTSRRGKRSSIARSKRRIRRLRGNAKGRFRTRGRYSAATVRGTIWEVSDRCDGTLTKVRRGRVSVRDLRKRKNILLRAGKSYLARAPG